MHGDEPGGGPGEGAAGDEVGAVADAITDPAGPVAGGSGVGAVCEDAVQDEVEEGAVEIAPMGADIGAGEMETRRSIAVVTVALRSPWTAVDDEAQVITQTQAEVEDATDDGAPNSDGADPADDELAALVSESDSNSNTTAPQ